MSLAPLLNKNTLLASGILAVLIGVFYSGANWQSNKCQVKLTAQKEAAFKQLQIEQIQANQIARRYEKERAIREQAARVITQKVNHVIQKTVYSTCRVDDDGMRLLTNAIHQANRASKFDLALPANTESAGP